jgi:hypothetical protein
MSERLPVPILQNALHKIDVEPTDPIGKSVLAQDRQNLAPTIDVAIDIRDRTDLHTANLGRTLERWVPWPLL